MYLPSNDREIARFCVDLDSPEISVRYGAIRGLARLAVEDSSAMEVLVGAVRSRRLLVPDFAARELCRLGRKVNTFLPTLNEALITDDVAQLQAALKVLLKLAPESTLVEPLIAALQHEEFRICALAARYLGCIGRGCDRVVPHLANALSDGNAEVRWEAAKALANLWSEAEEAVSSLALALEDEDARVRRASANALGRIGSKAAASAPALVEGLYDEHAMIRVAAAYALGHMYDSAQLSVSALIGALADPNAGVRGAAAWALGRLGPEAERAKAALAEMLTGEENPWVRDLAANAVHRLDAMYDHT